jgi:hypothetical protein
MKNQKIIFTTVLLVLASFFASSAALARQPQATPTPTPTPPGEDRGNNNSAAERVNALNIAATGPNNTAHGWNSLSANTEGSDNTANGFEALLTNTTGIANTATGSQALLSNTSGSWNNAVGRQALFSNLTGEFNNAVGGGALYSNTNAMSNNAFGDSALSSNSTGADNTAMGDLALASNTTGSGNVAIGAQASQTLYRLKPVTYRYKKEIDQRQVLNYGLIAEDVAEIDSSLIVLNKDGQIESVRYNAINVMLLNEFIKEHKAFVEEQDKVKKLEAGVAGLLATMKEQAAQIEKVSAEVQMSRTVPLLVTSP